VIIDITMFHVILRHSSGNIITYPNNLILQKGVIKVLVDPELKSETVDTKLIKAEDSGK
jgi:small-conductance mechanosensitive channel